MPIVMLNAEANREAESEGLEDERALLLKRVAASAPFRSSARLREFLLYIGDCALREAPADATEQQIALRVFKRPPGLNSSEDSIVRTHARLLRQKLATYFLEEGIHEPITIEVPKGHYLVVFKSREEVPPPAKQGPVEANALASTKTSLSPLPVTQPHLKTSLRKYALLATIFCTALILLSVVGLHGIRRAAPPGPVEQLWKPFLTGGPPLVVFSNALFQGDAKRGLSYAPPLQNYTETGSNLVDTYTGVGELTAVYTLTQLFDAHQSQFVLKRSQLMTWDEAKVHNLIFIGSTAENPSLKALQSSLDFSIVASPDAAGVENHHRSPGEPAVYWRPEHPLTRDYAIVALMPGMAPGERILVFSGLTTFGTQAAVEFVCRPDSAAELLRRVAGPKGEVRPFEAVIETTITGGVPLNAHLITAHVH